MRRGSEGKKRSLRPPHAPAPPSLDINGGSAVDEAALADGTNPSSPGESTSGTFTTGEGDGIQALLVNGVDVTNGGTIAGKYGVLVVTGSPQAGYNWNYTLGSNTIDHPNANSTGTDEGIFDSFSVVVANAAGVTASNVLKISVLDDGPAAAAEASQDVLEGATVTGTLDFAGGADGATVTHIDGTLLVFGTDGFSQAIDIGAGSIKVKADGSYSFTADTVTTSPVAPTGATYTVTDGDGDTATSSIAFQVVDANVPTPGTAAAAVDDDGLAGGNAASTAGDLDANVGDLDGAASSEATFSACWAAASAMTCPARSASRRWPARAGTVGLEKVTYSWNAGSNTLTATTVGGTRPGTALFTVQVTDAATGA